MSSETIFQNSEVPSDGTKRIRTSEFNTKQGKPIRLTNDERRSLLALFNPGKRIKSAWITIAAGICGAVFGAIFSMFIAMNTGQVSGILAVCLAIPGLLVAVYGAYGVVTAPNIQKSQLSAYELRADAIFIATPNHKRSAPGVTLHRIVSISARDAGLFDPSRESGTHIRLAAGGIVIELRGTESYSAIRHGLAEGDSIRCAVLECGKYCWISIF